MNTIGERLRSAREQAGLSQGQVARLLHLHRPTISEIEANRRRITLEELPQFAKAYGVSVAWLMGAEPNEEGFDERVLLAAREFSKLAPEDLDQLLRILQTLRKAKDSNK
jgi:transcriptional regulator with XRE-family HTH domain